MAELNDHIYEQITALCEQGDELADADPVMAEGASAMAVTRSTVPIWLATSAVSEDNASKSPVTIFTSLTRSSNSVWPRGTGKTPSQFAIANRPSQSVHGLRAE